ncbi:MAG: tRNA1(Val) (adenine(37)-N6)-methyltransferase [Caldicoprobacterales bacterium]|jgi:tRNA1Val (adenine37-N6)-methyltransferase|nr:tRNA1(Val) (adenine(37)-N6)-methyltransferase [Clostridiales bacterium]
MDVMIKENERVDDLDFKGLKIIQDPKSFRFGMDAVLLSHFAKPRPGDKVVDLGTGTGIIPILMAGRNMDAKFYGIEIQPSMADMAKRSVALNDLEDRIEIIEGDLKESPHYLGTRRYQLVTANPPYKKVGTGLINPNQAKAVARHEILCSLDDVLMTAAKLLVMGGRLAMVHRPNRLTDILLGMKEYGLEPKNIRLVYPNLKKSPNMVLIEAVLGGRPYLSWMPPLIVFKDNGEFTDELKAIYYESLN